MCRNVAMWYGWTSIRHVDTAATARLLHAALSAKAGKPLPWTPVRRALEEGFCLGLFERLLTSGP